MIDILPNL